MTLAGLETALKWLEMVYQPAKITHVYAVLRFGKRKHHGIKKQMQLSDVFIKT